jgi:hypothetical protein
MNTPYSIYFKIGNEFYLGAQIRASNKKIELFYHYGNSKNKKSYLENLETGEMANGYLPDHVSFHFNGQIHTKAQNDKRKKFYFSEVKCDHNPFNLQRNHFAPIFLESINISNEELINLRLKKVEKEETFNQPLVDLTEFNSFSIILFSKCERTNPNDILKDRNIIKLNSIVGIRINNVFSAIDKAKKIEKTSGFSTDIVVLIVQNVFEHFTEIEHHTTGEIGTQSSISVVTPTIELIGGMINLNKKC